MKERFESTCPLCGGNGSYVFADADNYKAYTCTDCGIFEISTHAEKVLKDMLPQRQSFYASLARSAPAGKMLEISFEVLTAGNRVAHRYINVHR